MAELAEALRGLGFGAVTTYLQSGNAVFSATGRPERVAGSVEACLAERFGLGVPVLVRTQPEMEDLVEANPFLAEGADPASLHVTFLAEEPGPAARSLEPPPGAGRDRFVCAGREVFVHCPGGYGRTKLDNSFFERRLGTAATTRNWRTVTALAELAGAAGRP